MTFKSQLKRSVMLNSVEDTIRVLENNPVRPDMVVELTIAQVMNRVSTAHLSIERGIKFVITEAGGPLVKDHDLPSRLKELRQQEPDSAKFLEEAFEEAVQHYRYNSNAPRMKHLKSLETYLNETGSDKDFQDIRYWELTQSTDELLVRQVYLQLHLELLRAVEELLMPPGRTKETVSLRVERAVITAMESQNLAYAPGTERELSVKSFLKWLGGFKNPREAMTKALTEGEAPSDEFTLDILRKAHQQLADSTDPAVRYFAEILTVLPHQPRDPVPCVEWLGSEKHQTGQVSTPAGDNLGFIFRRPDGLWSIKPSRNIAETQTDARCFLASLLTRPARAIVNGSEKHLRIVGKEYDLFGRKYNRTARQDEDTNDSQWPTHEVNFWDNEHGIIEGDNVKLEVPSQRSKHIADVLEGTVTGVTDQKVFVYGVDSIVSTKTTPPPQLQERSWGGGPATRR